MTWLFIFFRVMLDPVHASYVGAALAGHGDFGPTLVKICDRESAGKWCTFTRVHAGDSAVSSRVWAKAARVGWLDPQCQPHEEGEYATRGVHGMMAGYSLRHLPRCTPPWVLDIPLVSAYVATVRAHSPMCERVPSCMSWRST